MLLEELVGKLIGNNDKQRFYTTVVLGGFVIFISGFIFSLDGVSEYMNWGPSDDLVVLGTKFNTWSKYLSLIFVILIVEISIRLLKLYAKSQEEYYLKLPTNARVVGYSKWEFLALVMVSNAESDYFRAILFFLFISRVDIIFLLFMMKNTLLFFAYFYKSSTMMFGTDDTPYIISEKLYMDTP